MDSGLSPLQVRFLSTAFIIDGSSSLYFSLAVSIKMNILLMAPALFVILLLSIGLQDTLRCIAYCALLQVSFGV